MQVGLYRLEELGMAFHCASVNAPTRYACGIRSDPARAHGRLLMPAHVRAVMWCKALRKQRHACMLACGAHAE